jgi:uncharacterized protein (DUF433 family)
MGQVTHLGEEPAMTLPDFLTEHAFGAIRLTGTRIGLEHVLELCKSGYSPELIKEEFDHVPLAQIYKVIAFYLENRAEVEEYLRDCRGRAEQLMVENPPSAALLRMRQLLE